MTVVIAIIALGFAGVAIGLAIRNASLEVTAGRFRGERDKSEAEHKETRTEFEKYQASSARQLERLRDEITDLQDVLATCADPDVIHGHLDRLLQKAAGGDSSPNSD